MFDPNRGKLDLLHVLGACLEDGIWLIQFCFFPEMNFQFMLKDFLADFFSESVSLPIEMAGLVIVTYRLFLDLAELKRLRSLHNFEDVARCLLDIIHLFFDRCQVRIEFSLQLIVQACRPTKFLSLTRTHLQAIIFLKALLARIVGRTTG